MAHVLCILALVCFVSSFAEKSKNERALRDLDLLSWFKSQETWVRYFYLFIYFFIIFNLEFIYVVCFLYLNPGPQIRGRIRLQVMLLHNSVNLVDNYFSFKNYFTDEI